MAVYKNLSHSAFDSHNSPTDAYGHSFETLRLRQDFWCPSTIETSAIKAACIKETVEVLEAKFLSTQEYPIERLRLAEIQRQPTSADLTSSRLEDARNSLQGAIERRPTGEQTQIEILKWKTCDYQSQFQSSDEPEGFAGACKSKLRIESVQEAVKLDPSKPGFSLDALL